MPKILPFRAHLYHSKLRPELGKLISPPYDVISAEHFERLKNLSPYQSVRLALADNASDPERYTKMKGLFSDWKKNHILELFAKPAFYLIEDTFSSEGRSHRRVGFVALLEVTPFENKEVLPHEFTLSGPKVDRLQLLKTMRAETSQIFLCYKDEQLSLEKLWEKRSKEAPLMECLDTTGVARKVWALSEGSEIQTLEALIQSRSLLIADGHHRYETAVNYSAESKYVQVYLTNLNSPGFSILPIHRLFSLPTNLNSASFVERLSESFDARPWKDEVSVSTLAREKQKGDLKLFCCFQDGSQFLLTQKKASATEAEIFSIHRYIFESILGWNVKELAKGTIQYEHETSDFKKQLSKIPNGVGLFLPPTDLELVMTLAQRGERMPQKSTFFYPKLASGLINFALDNY